MVSLEERERAETLRSAFEASQTTTQLSQLLTPAETIERYRTPPKKTAFPLEYAFYLLGDVRGKTVLEYGCGDGENTVVLANRGARVIAFDISPELLAVAKERLEVNRCKGVELLLGSAHNLPLPDESIDVVFGMAILHHLDLDIASREIRRVLRKGGRGIFEEPLRNSRLYARARQFLPMRADVSPFERPLTDREIENFATSCPQRVRTFQLLLSSVANVLPFGRRQAVGLCAHLDTSLLRLVPLLDHYATIKVFEMVKQ